MLQDLQNATKQQMSELHVQLFHAGIDMYSRYLCGELQYLTYHEMKASTKQFLNQPAMKEFLAKLGNPDKEPS